MSFIEVVVVTLGVCSAYLCYQIITNEDAVVTIKDYVLCSHIAVHMPTIVQFCKCLDDSTKLSNSLRFVITTYLLVP